MGWNKGLKAAVLVLPLALAPLGLRAQDCGHAPLIRTLALDVLARRPELPKFQERRYGVLEAYLAWRYGAIDLAGLQVQLAELEQARVREANWAAAALAASQGDIGGALARFDPDPAIGLARAGTSTWRAVLLRDAGVSFFRLAQLAPRSGDTDYFHASLMLGHTVPLLIADQTEDLRRQVAEQAEAAGYLALAAAILSDFESLDAYNSLLEKHAGAEGLDHARAPGLHYSGSGLRYRDTPIPNDPAAPEILADHAALFQVIRASMAEEVAPLLGIVTNQTGETARIAPVAQAYVAAIAAGQIDPVRHPEQGWLFLDSALSDAMGEGWGRALSGFDWPWGSVRHFAGRAADSFDVIRATAALAPVLDGGAVAAPFELRGTTLDWLSWEFAARRLAQDAMAVPRGEAEVVPFIELLFAAGRAERAVELARQVLPPEAVVAVEHDLMQRLDRLCQGWTAYPGQALILGGQVLLRF